MPITKSAKKALRQSFRRRARNLIYKKKMRAAVKQARSLVSDGKQKQAKELLPKIYKVLDKAAKKGVLKKNTASRKKSRIAKVCARVVSDTRPVNKKVD